MILELIEVCFCVWRWLVRNYKCKVLENKHFIDTNFTFCNFELDATGCGKGSFSRTHEALRVIRISTVEKCTAISSWYGTCTRCVGIDAVPSACQSTGEWRMGMKCITIYIIHVLIVGRSQVQECCFRNVNFVRCTHHANSCLLCERNVKNAPFSMASRLLEWKIQTIFASRPYP